MSTRQTWLQLGLILGILLFINVLGSNFHGQFDLTEDKRFTLTAATRTQLKQIKEVVFIKVLLDGEFPAGFKRLQRATKEILDDFHNESAMITYQFEDPTTGTPEEVAKRSEQLGKDGIKPFSLFIVENGQKTQRLAYPYAIISYNNRQEVVKLLENQVPGSSQEVVLNNSVSMLEYKLTSAIRNVINNTRPNVAFVVGHGELAGFEMADLLKSLQGFYNTVPVDLDSTFVIKPEIIPALIVAKPRRAFSDRDKFVIDQYVMHGGKIIWLVDRLAADTDSLARYPRFSPVDYPTNLEDILFKYGVRVQPNLVLDLECGAIALSTGKPDEAKAPETFPWPYYPVAAPRSDHPIVKNLDRVWFRYPSSIDTIQTKTYIKKTILLASSNYSRIQRTPVEIGLETVKNAPDKKQFNQPNQSLAVLLEGEFPSVFENRVSSEMQQALNDIKSPFIAKSKPTSMIVVSDGDVARNDISTKDNSHLPLGYSRDANYCFDNKDFIMNGIEYMLGNNGNLQARSKNVTLRLLDAQASDAQKTLWQVFNIGGPLMLVGIFGWLFTWLRRRKYAGR